LSSKPVIAIDVDDVLADSAEGFVAFSNKRWGTNLTVEDYDERWSQMWGVDIEEERRRAHIIYNSNVVGKFKHFEEAKEVLRELKKHYKLVITTSRVRFVEKETLAWIDKHYKDIFEEIHLAGFYDELKTDSHKQTKAELCQSIGASYLIDDHPKHCFAAAEVGVKAILFGDYPWSRDLQLPAGVTRVAHWHDIKRYFDEERRTSV
jgi:5'(3')-deoxyribonucleotidase